jgi:hypothetical protein
MDEAVRIPVEFKRLFRHSFEVADKPFAPITRLSSSTSAIPNHAGKNGITE